MPLLLFLLFMAGLAAETGLGLAWLLRIVEIRSGFDRWVPMASISSWHLFWLLLGLGIVSLALQRATAESV
jgi:hypothetical protein